jgi:hypothetical protein
MAEPGSRNQFIDEITAVIQRQKDETYDIHKFNRDVRAICRKYQIDSHYGGGDLSDIMEQLYNAMIEIRALTNHKFPVSGH